MKRYSNRKAQRGFALLEVLLAIIIIAIVSLAVVQLYSRATAGGALSAEETIIGQITTAHQQYVSANYVAPTSAQDLVNAGLVPKDITDVDDFSGPFGKITYTPDDTGDNISVIHLTAIGVPGQSQGQFCVDMSKAYDVVVGGTLYSDAADCNATTSPFVGGGSGTADFDLYSPKGSYSGS